MQERVRLILKLIEEGLTLDEIQRRLNLNHLEFSKALKIVRDCGYNLNKSYFSDGTIKLALNKTLNFPSRNKIRINVKGNVFRTVFISDLHIGSVGERIDLLETVKNYVLKHNIHVIFNAGDFIENIYEDSTQELINPTLESQVKKVLKSFPKENKLITFTLYGNHDYKSLKDVGFDIARYLEEKRYDLVSLGYGHCEILLKNDCIGIIHALKKGYREEAPKDASITFKGHSHKSKNSHKENKIIFVPSMSESYGNAYEYRPLLCFLDVEFVFVESKIERVNIKQLAMVNNEIRLANEEAIILRKKPMDRGVDQKV